MQSTRERPKAQAEPAQRSSRVASAVIQASSIFRRSWARGTPCSSPSWPSGPLTSGEGQSGPLRPVSSGSPRRRTAPLTSSAVAASASAGSRRAARASSGPWRGGGPGSGGEQALEIDGVGVNHGLDHPQPGRGQQAQLEAGDLDPRPADPRPVVLGEGGPPPADLQVGLAQGALHAVKGALAGQAEARHPRAQGRHAEQREGGEAAARQPPPHRGRRRGRAAGRARRGWCAAGRLGRGPARSGRGRAPRGRRPRAKPGAPRRR
jgi:hypothetical protein